MVKDLKITAIVENTAGTFDAAGEWGLDFGLKRTNSASSAIPARDIRYGTMQTCLGLTLGLPMPWLSVMATSTTPGASPS